MDSTPTTTVTMANQPQSPEDEVLFQSTPHLKYFIKQVGPIVIVTILLAVMIFLVRLIHAQYNQTTQDRTVDIPVNDTVYALLITLTFAVGGIMSIRALYKWKTTSYVLTPFTLSIHEQDFRPLAIRGVQGDTLACKKVFRYSIARTTLAELYIFRNCRTITVVTDTKEDDSGSVEGGSDLRAITFKDVKNYQQLTDHLDQLIKHYASPG